MAEATKAVKEQDSTENDQRMPLHPTPLNDAVNALFLAYKSTKNYFGVWKTAFDFAEGTLGFMVSAINTCVVSPSVHFMGGRAEFNKMINALVKTANRRLYNAQEHLEEGFKTFWSSEFDLEDDWFLDWWEGTKDDKKKKRKGASNTDGISTWKVGSTSELDGIDDSMGLRSIEWDSVEVEDNGHLSSKSKRSQRRSSQAKYQGIEGSGDSMPSNGSDEESVSSTSSDRDPWWRRVFRRQGQRSRGETNLNTEHEGSPRVGHAIKSLNDKGSKGTIHKEIMNKSNDQQESETDSKLGSSLSHLENETRSKDVASSENHKTTVISTQNLMMDASVNSPEHKVLPKIIVSPSGSDTESLGPRQTEESLVE